MNDKQKAQIARMRERGDSFADIAKAIGVSENTVKSYIRRSQQTKKCDQCGREITQQKGTKPRRFCSDACRYAWWKAHTDEALHKREYTFTCNNCGKQFSVYRDRKRSYCSRECYLNERYGRQL